MPSVTALRTEPRLGHLPVADLEEQNQRLRTRNQRYAGMLHRMVNEIEGLWQVSETLGRSTDAPEALELVTHTVGQLTEADAAAVLLDLGPESVVASRWGALAMSIGTKEEALQAALARDYASTALEPIADAGRRIGSLWIGRSGGKSFGSTETLVLKTLAAMTSLAVTTLRERCRHGETALTQTRAHPVPHPSPLEAPRPDSGEDSSSTTTPGRQARILATLGPVPAFSPALARLLAVADDAGDEVAAVEAILQLDPALADLVIRAARSAAYARARPVAHVSDALVVLGLRGVRHLAAAQFTRHLFTSRAPAEMLLWEQAIGTAVRTQAALELLEPAAADAGYLAGLLHNVGALALADAYPEQYARVLRDASAGVGTIAERERAEIGIDGAAVTAHFLERWHVPAALLAVLHAPKNSVAARALDWAEHATLAANPAWNALDEHEGTGSSDTWFGARCKRSALDLGWSELDGHRLENRARERLEGMRSFWNE